MLDTFYYITDGFLSELGQRGFGVIKTDRQGNILQQVIMEGQYQDLAIVEGGAYAFTSDGNILFVGESWHPANGGNMQVCLVKMTPDLTILWTHYYGDSTYNEYGTRVLEMPDSQYMIYGSRNYLNGYVENLLIKTDTAGTLIWDKTPQDTFDRSLAGNMVATLDGNAVFCTETRHDPSWPDEWSNALVVKVDPEGEVLWRRKMKGVSTSDPRQYPQITALHNGGYALAWWKDTSSFIPYEFPVLLGLDSEGHVQWSHEWLDDTYRVIYTMKTAANGDILACGEYGSYSIFYSTWLLRASPEGEILWEQYYSDSLIRPWYIMEPFDLTETPDGRIAVTGIVLDSTPVGPANVNIFLLVVDENGCLIDDCTPGYQLITDATIPADVQRPNRLVLSPNPAGESVNLIFPPVASSSVHRQVEMYDLVSGRLLQTRTLGFQEGIALPTQGLSNGLYLLVLRENGQCIAREKLLVQH